MVILTEEGGVPRVVITKVFRSRIELRLMNEEKLRTLNSMLVVNKCRQYFHCYIHRPLRL